MPTPKHGQWASDFMAAGPATIDWLVDDLIVRGGTVELYAETGIGKSFFAQQLMACLLQQTPFLGHTVRPCGPLLYAQAELMDTELRARLLTLAVTYPALRQPGLWLPATMYGQLDIPEVWREFELIARTLEPALIVLDPLSAMISSGDLNNTHGEVKRLLNHLDSLRAHVGCAVLVVHHTRKTRLDKAGEPVSLGKEESAGSREVVQWAGTIVRLHGDPIDTPRGRQVMVVEKLRSESRYGRHKVTTPLVFDTSRFVFSIAGQ